MNEVELRFASMQDEIESENAVYNDYEMNIQRLESADAVKTSAMTDAEEQQMLLASRELASIREREDVLAEEMKKVKVAERGTHDDDESLRRCLNDDIHYVVHDDCLLKADSYVYPYTELQPDETLRQSCERLLADQGISEGVHFRSNAPVGVMKINFKKDEERGRSFQGAKVFFMKAFVNEGVEELGRGNFKWRTIDEMQEIVDSEYYKRVHRFMA